VLRVLFAGVASDDLRNEWPGVRRSLRRL